MMTFVPVGGLANRMRGILAAISLVRDVQSDLSAIWYRNWGLGCRFEQLFQPLSLPKVKMEEAKIADLILCDRPRKRNFYLPYLFQLIKYNGRIYEKESSRLMREGFDFKKWALDKKELYIASYSHFYSEPNKKLYQLFKPKLEILLQVEEIAENFNSATIGIHIRRTDNIVSINQSPTLLFIQHMESEIERNPETNFYLVTDSEEEKAALQNRFGNKLMTSSQKAERGSLSGMQHAVVELYLLSKTSIILGSSYSSYSETAALIGNVRYEIIQKET